MAAKSGKATKDRPGLDFEEQKATAAYLAGDVATIGGLVCQKLAVVALFLGFPGVTQGRASIKKSLSNHTVNKLGMDAGSLGHKKDTVRKIV